MSKCKPLEGTPLDWDALTGTNDPSEPDFQSPSLAAQHGETMIVRDVFAGTLRLRARGKDYLPQFPRERDDDYDTRLSMAVLYNATRRTIKGLVGLIYRKPPTLADDVPPEIGAHWEDIDLAGRHGDEFCRDFTNETVKDGHRHILVDMHQAEPVRNLSEERSAGLRPYWVEIAKTQVLSYRTERIGGKQTFTQFAYWQDVSEPDGAFGEKTVRKIYVRTLIIVGDSRRVELRVYRKPTEEENKTEKKRWVLDQPPRLLNGISRITVTTAYGGDRVDFMVSRPALSDLALENIRHYQLRSDRDNTLHICGVPIPVTIGMPEGEVGKTEVGPGHGFNLPIGGDAKYLEPQGVALGATREELKDIEGRMAALGLAMLERNSHAAETAESRRLEKSEQDSQLTSIVRSVEDAIEEALSFHAEWLGLDSGGSVEINRDFENQLLDAATIRELGVLVSQDDLDQDTLWDILLRAEILPDSFDPEVARANIAARAAAQMAVAAKQQRLARPPDDGELEDAA